jgi:hypothetical protein
MTTRTDAARIAATSHYAKSWQRLAKAAREAERSHRPTLATELRRQAAWAHRAALAEERDDPPIGMWQEDHHGGD